MSGLLVTDVKFQRKAKKLSRDNYITYNTVGNKKSFIQAFQFFPWITINHLHAISPLLFCLCCSVCHYYFPFFTFALPLVTVVMGSNEHRVLRHRWGQCYNAGEWILAINSLIHWHMHLLFSCLYTIGTHLLIHLLKYTFS